VRYNINTNKTNREGEKRGRIEKIKERKGKKWESWWVIKKKPDIQTLKERQKKKKSLVLEQ
jgi:adenosyl cobinamide kinase/adenosyl cobinamide phosphate guanylyltransferase